MKNLIKKWWFWGIIIVICILSYILISKHIENKKLEKTFENMGKGASDFITDIDNSESHIDEFSYNYETGEVEYKPSNITLEMYNRIKEGMTQEEVISILGKYETKSEGENTYVLEWGNSYAPINNGYWLQIVFDTTHQNVLNTYQVGLK